MSHDLFISYSTKNKDAAESVVAGLEKEGLRCWIAPRDILPGTPYGEAIIQAIDSCRILLLILSEASNSSKQVLREVDHASSLDKDILPFLIDDVQPSGSMAYYLGPEQWLDASMPPLEAHLEVLVNAVRNLVGSGQPAGESSGDPESIEPTGTESTNGETVPANQLPGREETEPELQTAAYNIQINPFSFGNPVFTQEKFIGREGDIRQIISRLLSAGESTSVVGERRIGKTSLLRFISHPANARMLGLQPDTFCLVYIDFQGLTDITPRRFWERILRKMEDSICKQELVPVIQELRQREEFDLFDLEDLFGAVSSAGMTTVLLMDEFEYVTQNPNFGSDFFGGLRALAIHRDLPLITGTRRELIDLCHSDEIKGSPFFNIFVNLILRPFSREEVVDMVRSYSASAGEELEDRELEEILGLSGGYPFFVQMAGYYLLEGKWKGLEGEDLFQDLRVNFNNQADPHFSYFWSHCSESEKITLLAVFTLARQDPAPDLHPTLENTARIHSRAHVDIPELMKRGLLLTDQAEQTYALFSSSFGTWIQREITAVSGEEESQESVEEWLASGGLEKTEEIKGVLPNIKKKYWPLIGKVTQEMSFELAGAAAFELIARTLL